MNRDYLEVGLEVEISPEGDTSLAFPEVHYEQDLASLSLYQRRPKWTSPETVVNCRL
jgi:hypothetical protein